MPELRGVMPYHVGDVAFEPCIWCQKPTDLRFMPEAMPELGPQPLHLFCAADLLLTFEALRAQRRIAPVKAERLGRLQRLALH